MNRASVGLEVTSCPDINDVMDDAVKAGFQFISIPIVNPRNNRDGLHDPAKSRPGPLTRTDLLLTGTDWAALVVGKFSPWIQLDNSPDEFCRRNAEIAFRQEMSFMTHLGLPAILFELKSTRCANMAKLICEFMHNGPEHMYWIRVPVTSPKDSLDDVFSEDQDKPADYNLQDNDPWRWWSKLRTLCDNNKRLVVALELTANLPSEEHMFRWAGEPVKCLIIPTSVFLTNKKGFPVLPRAHQSFVKHMLSLNVQFIISGINRHQNAGFQSYVQYLDHIVTNQPELDSVSKFAKGYEDFLQCPLQPLMDNLESSTYEIFERDPFKYCQYQEAITEALLDRVSDDDKDTTETIIMVVGAGRGPLVKAALRAATNAQRKVHLYAVEKNPNACVTLEGLKAEEWGDQVTVVSCDMRQWKAPVQADILVSELLGSFGDNELSPECLDGAQCFLKEDGISIPSSYTSYICPIMSGKLHNEVRFTKDKEKHPDAPFETPYVVRLHNCYLPISNPVPLFTFVHPNRDKIIDNNRYKSVDFTIPEECVIHGIAGYFDSVLYKTRTMSIVPATHSPGMFSWFPILFPIKTPMTVAAGENVRVHFWRVCTDKNVWYEWTISEPRSVTIHNSKGRSYTIGL